MDIPHVVRGGILGQAKTQVKRAAGLYFSAFLILLTASFRSSMEQAKDIRT